MGIRAEWGDPEKSYVLITFDPQWTIEDFYEVNGKQVPEMMRSVPYKVHNVTDFTHTSARHMRNALVHARNISVQSAKNSGKAIVISNNAFINSLVNIFRTIFKGNFGDTVILVRTMEEAQQALAALVEEKAAETTIGSTV